ncbi:hypothetical protein Tco_1064007 [Tanacetum coccineum]
MSKLEDRTTTSKFQNLLKIGLLVWGKLIQKLVKKESIKKSFQDMQYELGEVNQVHSYYNGSSTSKDKEYSSLGTTFGKHFEEKNVVETGQKSLLTPSGSISDEVTTKCDSVTIADKKNPLEDSTG